MLRAVVRSRPAGRDRRETARSRTGRHRRWGLLLRAGFRSGCCRRLPARSTPLGQRSGLGRRCRRPLRRTRQRRGRKRPRRRESWFWRRRWNCLGAYGRPYGHLVTVPAASAAAACSARFLPRISLLAYWHPFGRSFLSFRVLFPAQRLRRSSGDRPRRSRLAGCSSPCPVSVEERHLGAVERHERRQGGGGPPARSRRAGLGRGCSGFQGPSGLVDGSEPRSEQALGLPDVWAVRGTAPEQPPCLRTDSGTRPRQAPRMLSGLGARRSPAPDAGDCFGALQECLVQHAGCCPPGGASSPSVEFFRGGSAHRRVRVPGESGQGVGGNPRRRGGHLAYLRVRGRGERFHSGQRR